MVSGLKVEVEGSRCPDGLRRRCPEALSSPAEVPHQPRSGLGIPAGDRVTLEPRAHRQAETPGYCDLVLREEIGNRALRVRHQGDGVVGGIPVAATNDQVVSPAHPSVKLHIEIDNIFGTDPAELTLVVVSIDAQERLHLEAAAGFACRGPAAECRPMPRGHGRVDLVTLD